jgi:biopolymer transport protein ExbB
MPNSCGCGVVITGRPRFLLVMVGLGLVWFGWVTRGSVYAQESDRVPAAASPAPANPGGAEADTQAGSSAYDSSGTFLSWMIRASGPIGLVIALMSFYLIALIVWMALNYRAPVAVPSGMVREVQVLLEKSKYNEAYQRLTEDSSFLARVLSAGVRKLATGLVPAQRAMELANEDATMEMEHRTTYLATVGTLGPMIGLVGTVYGMILSFRVIAVEGSSPQASQLAAGISTALFATLEGIALSIPAIYFYALFRNRIARISLEVGMTAEVLLEQFAPGVRLSPPSGSATGPVPPSTPPAHAHPFAVSAALAAASAHSTRPALPPAGPSPDRDN